MTGIEKMIGVLKRQIIKTSHGDLTEFGEGCIFFLKDMLDNAEMFHRQEQDSEVVLGEGAFGDVVEKVFYSRGLQTFHLGVTGQLIFRPTTDGTKEGR